MKRAVFIFPTHLFKEHPFATKDSLVFLIEHPRYFTDFSFHKQKLVLHRASMKVYERVLKNAHKSVHYIEFDETKKIMSLLKKNLITSICYADPVDHTLHAQLKKEFSEYSHEVCENPGFISDRAWLKKALGNKKHCTMNSFYQSQRKRLNILMKDGKPVGGKWSYDTQNRMAAPKQMEIPCPAKPRTSKDIQEAIEYVEHHFKENPGDSQQFMYPVTHAQADTWFENFLHQRLENFGPYQDAIIAENNFMFHSVLSPLLNTGLLKPTEVVTRTLEFAKKNKMPINSLEGFLRQVIGWREFVYGIYLLYGEKQKTQNHFHHTRKLPKTFWTGKTGIRPIDTTIQKILKTAYAHHIERLMILGNYMLLTETDPHDVYKWFMELFIDSYDWVMVPNVYGMSQYADGGFMTSKPYFSSSNYILKMSTYQKGSWCAKWDGLFWNFIIKHKVEFSKNARLARTVALLKKMSPEKIHRHLTIARALLDA